MNPTPDYRALVQRAIQRGLVHPSQYQGDAWKELRSAQASECNRKRRAKERCNRIPAEIVQIRSTDSPNTR